MVAVNAGRRRIMRLPTSVHAWLKTIVSNKAARAAGVLVGGTAIGQLISVIALPIITRLYSPADFTVLAVFNGLLLIIAMAAAGRFDIAIPLPDSDEEAANLLVLSVLCSLFTALATALILLIFGPALARWASIESAEPYLWLLPISILQARRG